MCLESVVHLYVYDGVIVVSVSQRAVVGVGVFGTNQHVFGERIVASNFILGLRLVPFSGWAVHVIARFYPQFRFDDWGHHQCIGTIGLVTCLIIDVGIGGIG